MSLPRRDLRALERENGELREELAMAIQVVSGVLAELVESGSDIEENQEANFLAGYIAKWRSLLDPEAEARIDAQVAAGIGGLELGLERAGLGHVVWQCANPRSRRGLDATPSRTQKRPPPGGGRFRMGEGRRTNGLVTEEG